MPVQQGYQTASWLDLQMVPCPKYSFIFLSVWGKEMYVDKYASHQSEERYWEKVIVMVGVNR